MNDDDNAMNDTTLVSSQVPENDPIMLAWKKHKETLSYAISKKWAGKPDHLEGALWTLFCAGWAAGAEDAHGERAGKTCTSAVSDEIERLRRALIFAASWIETGRPIEGLAARMREAAQPSPK